MALEAMGYDVNSSDFVWVHVIAKKLDPASRRERELHHGGDDAQTMDGTKQFLEERARALEFSVTSLEKTNIKTSRDKEKKDLQMHHNRSDGGKSCSKCSADHGLYACEEFKALIFDEKSAFIKEKGLCFNCLRSGHNSKDCKSKTGCRICKKRHNTLLHKPSDPKNNDSAPQTCLGHWGDTWCGATLLPTAMVNVQSASDQTFSLRALLDSGSQLSCITEKARKWLGLKSKRAEIEISELGGNFSAQSGSIVKLQLVPRSHKAIHTTAVVLERLTKPLPAQPLRQINRQHLQGLQLADPSFNSPGEVDIILGGDVFEQVLGNQKKAIGGGLFARSTVFGWVISGKMLDCCTNRIQTFHVTLDEQLQKFWELEEIPQQKHWSAEEIACEKHFDQHTEVIDNRFVVSLPFRDSSSLGNSKEQALKRFRYLEKRLEAKPILRKQYSKFIQECVDMNHMEELTDNDTLQRPDHESYYLPHHCVLKEDSTTTKLRVVFDGSAKTSSNMSINDVLMVDPVVQDDLFSIVTRFRFYKIALSADIEKMYRQVALREKDRDFHPILWRDSSSAKPKHFRFTRVVYGISCSAHLSTRCLTEIANRTKKSNVEQALRTSFYVDDFLGGAQSVEEAKSLIADLNSELLEYGFPLRKWSSSDSDLIKDLSSELRAENDDLKLFSEDYKIKALGVSWKPNQDVFGFKYSQNNVNSLTKRNLLSATSKLFDPLGWLAPIIIQFKILMQQTWVRGLQWDDVVPDDVKEIWNDLQTHLPAIQDIKISRCVISNVVQTLQLHIFADASEKAYAAVAFSRATDVIGHVNTSLLSSKTRVAPVKTVSLPRLELCGADLAAKLAKTLMKILDVTGFDISLHAWTDSTIVLQWLSQLPKTWTTFVANRVSQIQSTLPRSKWRHVPSLENPADLASRGCKTSELTRQSLWWNGPL